jgi:DNA helicase-2/ATP-dependent DNA helicase PcrA
VFLVGLTDGTMPIQHAVTPDEVEEERRLLYVGVTRARSHLHLSWAYARAAGGRRGRRMSRFLEGVAPASARPAPVPKAAAKQARDAAREALSPEARALFDRLRDWRKERAAGLGQPAYCVFTDATLTAIATARPARGTELAGLPGVGATKLDKFGAEVLALVADS